MEGEGVLEALTHRYCVRPVVCFLGSTKRARDEQKAQLQQLANSIASPRRCSRHLTPGSVHAIFAAHRPMQKSRYHPTPLDCSGVLSYYAPLNSSIALSAFQKL